MEDLNLPTISSKGQENIGFESESTSVDAEIELKPHYNKHDLANGNSHHDHSKGHGHGHSHEHGHSHDHEEDTSYNGELLRKSETSASFHCHDEGETSEGDETNRKAKRILWLSVLICMFFMICEIVGGYIANSLAIVTDAAHLLTDLASMLISLFSLYIASRPASQKMSWGFHRAEVLGAFFSVFLIWIVTGVLVVLAVKRIIKGDEEVDAKIMAITASMGVLVNLIMGGLLFFGGGHGHSHGGSHGHSHGGAAKKKKASGHGHSHSEGDEEEGHGHSHKSGQNINVRAAFVHVLGDLVQSVGVLIAALVILIWPHMSVMDPICTLLFSVIVLSTTIYVLRDALVVLLEGRPSNVNFSEVFASLNGIEGVKKVHDLRIWALTMDKVALSVHLEVESESQSQKILRSTRVMLKNQYSVHESTVQIELYAQEKDDCGKCVPLK